MTRRVHLTFAFNYTLEILRGDKTVTARYDFERPVAPGDVLHMRTPAREHFATAEVEAVDTMTVFDVVAVDPDGHRSYETADELIEHLERFYPGVEMTPNTDLTLIRWTDAARPEHWRWEAMSR